VKCDAIDVLPSDQYMLLPNLIFCSRIWTYDVARALDTFIAFVHEGATMTTAQKQQRHKMLQKHQKKLSVSKSSTRPLSLPPSIPQALLDIIVRCLVPDRKQRFQVLMFCRNARFFVMNHRTWSSSFLSCGGCSS
jgi:hypothetical protein